MAQKRRMGSGAQPAAGKRSAGTKKRPAYPSSGYGKKAAVKSRKSKGKRQRSRLWKWLAGFGTAIPVALFSAVYVEPVRSGLEMLPGGIQFEQALDGLLSSVASQIGDWIGPPQVRVASAKAAVSPADIPAYSGYPYIEVNGNVPSFSEQELTTEDYEQYAPLDALGRCGVTIACVGTELMPTEERGAIGQVRPSGWHTVKYDCVDGKYLYNRCHLIGYQLSGENANERNLITGTRYLNIEGMLPFEDQVADYVHTTGNHVMYRVTPVFDGDNLVADGVEMEGYSVEDRGAGVYFHVFAYNVQPGVVIDYATGESWLEEGN